MKTEKATPDWGSAVARIKWLLTHRYGGSRSAMAKATGVSLTGLIKVLTDQQTPGRRLLEKVIQNTDVNPAWLFVGEGQPFRGSSIPMAKACLPGPPSEHEGAFIDGGVPEVAELFSPSRYWLKLEPTEPCVRAGGTKIAAQDLMLMETDRATFPPAEQLTGRWGVVRVPGRRGPVVRLAELTSLSESDDNGPAHLEAETYVTHSQTVRRIVVDKEPSINNSVFFVGPQNCRPLHEMRNPARQNTVSILDASQVPGWHAGGIREEGLRRAAEG